MIGRDRNNWLDGYPVVISTLLFAAIPACASVPSPLSPRVSGSVGGPSFGVLTKSAELPVSGPGFRRFRPTSDRYFGTETLVKTLEHAAASSSHNETDQPLLIGDIAQRGGGRMSGHHSHRTGRDVDLLFFYTTLGGAPIETPGFIKVQPDGLAFVRDRKPDQPHFVRLDVARSWSLVKALLSSPDAEIEWLFCSVPVEGLLTEYARAIGEPDDLVWHAESVLQQPTDGEAHDDHFHLRIRCTSDEEQSGCVSGGPNWPWLTKSATFSQELEDKLPELANEE